MDVVLDLLTAVWLAVFSAAEPAGTVVAGRAHVADGHSLRFGETSVRIYAIDAPERDQICNDQLGVTYYCGETSRAALKSLVGSNVVRCQVVDRDLYSRLVSKCYVNGTDLGAEMVRTGKAVAYTEYGGDYFDAETSARNNKIGIWSGTFQRPQDWRKAQR